MGMQASRNSRRGCHGVDLLCSLTPPREHNYPSEQHKGALPVLSTSPKMRGTCDCDSQTLVFMNQPANLVVRNEPLAGEEEVEAERPLQLKRHQTLFQAPANHIKVNEKKWLKGERTRRDVEGDEARCISEEGVPRSALGQQREGLELLQDLSLVSIPHTLLDDQIDLPPTGGAIIQQRWRRREASMESTPGVDFRAKHSVHLLSSAPALSDTGEKDAVQTSPSGQTLYFSNEPVNSFIFNVLLDA